jgi:glycosyltransferase involved in cell wall biosynthesis
MRILVCYTRFPWPTIRGDQLTVFKLLEYLAARHEVDFLCVSPSDSADVEQLPAGIRRFECVANPMPTRLGRIVRGFFGGDCLQVDMFFPGAFGAARKRLVEKGRYDIVYTHYIRSFGHKDFDPQGARKVIGLQLSHQAHFARAAKLSVNPLIRWLYEVETRRLEQWEGRIAGWNGLIHLISKRDLEQIRGHEQWRDRVFFNPHGVDDSVFVPAPERRVPGRVVFTGNLKFQANEDALGWFCAEIWPLILARHPGASLVVAGANPTARVQRALAGASRATLQPNPKHMWEVIQTADVAVDPLRIGAGLQNKILEALACGVPMVSTTLGNEGIGAAANREIVLADEPGDFAREVVQLLQHGGLREERSRASRLFIGQAWSWKHHFDQLAGRWEQLVITGK